ncbi:hypothetical protein CALVIDRAFT_45062 [Calocera viscosa TUFC12733]|uniref:protein-tyrosine-phosphatase n=1 Tax=Calocera viscosa (strain TUFC12733) TaxID=1330018 RepID=A0A167P432_CALVF|nr:hypothetical protein CALVIDRAFT_45062 [Calocera viscosa TUFC12733]
MSFPPSLAPQSGRKRSLPFSLRIQTNGASAPAPFALAGISSPAVAIPAQGITTALSYGPPPTPSAIEPEPSFSCFPPPIPALAPLPLPPHLRAQHHSPSGSSVPSLADSPSSTPSTAMSSTSSSSLPALDPSRGPRSGMLTARNPKKLSISTKPSWPTLQVNPAVNTAAERKRSNSVSLVLPYYSNTYPEEEEHDPPYPNGPIEILPRVWLGHEGHARDVKLLRERGIGWVLNVAKEVDLELGDEWQVVGMDGDDMDVDIQHGQSKLKYLKLPWSHGQQDLCEVGFNGAMRFVDRALSSGESVLVHCQCGVSRSATLVMALVIRAVCARQEPMGRAQHCADQPARRVQQEPADRGGRDRARGHGPVAQPDPLREHGPIADGARAPLFLLGLVGFLLTRSRLSPDTRRLRLPRARPGEHRSDAPRQADGSAVLQALPAARSGRGSAGTTAPAADAAARLASRTRPARPLTALPRLSPLRNQPPEPNARLECRIGPGEQNTLEYRNAPARRGGELTLAPSTRSHLSPA